jgi:hypothetical protein
VKYTKDIKQRNNILLSSDSDTLKSTAIAQNGGRDEEKRAVGNRQFAGFVDYEKDSPAMGPVSCEPDQSARQIALLLIRGTVSSAFGSGVLASRAGDEQG